MSDLIGRLKTLRLFLNGEGALQGMWFGDVWVGPGARGHHFWWRQYLRDLDEATDRLTELEAQLAEAQADAAALIEQGRRAGIEEAAECLNDRSLYWAGLREGALLDREIRAIRTLLTPERDTKADSDGDEAA